MFGKYTKSLPGNRRLASIPRMQPINAIIVMSSDILIYNPHVLIRNFWPDRRPFTIPVIHSRRKSGHTIQRPVLHIRRKRPRARMFQFSRSHPFSPYRYIKTILRNRAYPVWSWQSHRLHTTILSPFISPLIRMVAVEFKRRNERPDVIHAPCMGCRQLTEWAARMIASGERRGRRRRDWRRDHCSGRQRAWRSSDGDVGVQPGFMVMVGRGGGCWSSL